ncbi:MAG: hypothetical protein ACAH17_01980, partial [Candidatus Paceibacterota bacterium]
AGTAELQVRSNGFHDSESFFLDLQRLLPLLGGTPSAPALLILDGAKVHISRKVVILAAEHSVYIPIMPSHTSTTHQTLDRGPFASFSRIYLSNFEVWARLQQNSTAQIDLANQMILLLKSVDEWVADGNKTRSFVTCWAKVGLPDGIITPSLFDISTFREGRAYRDVELPHVSQRLLIELFHAKNLVGKPRSEIEVIEYLYSKRNTAVDLTCRRQRRPIIAPSDLARQILAGPDENATCDFQLHKYIFGHISRQPGSDTVANAVKSLYYGKMKTQDLRITELNQLFADLAAEEGAEANGLPYSSQHADSNTVPPFFTSAFGAILTCQNSYEMLTQLEEKKASEAAAAAAAAALFDADLVFEMPVLTALASIIDVKTALPICVLTDPIKKLPTVTSMKRYCTLTALRVVKNVGRALTDRRNMADRHDYIVAILESLHKPIPIRRVTAPPSLVTSLPDNNLNQLTEDDAEIAATAIQCISCGRLAACEQDVCMSCRSTQSDNPSTSIRISNLGEEADAPESTTCCPACGLIQTQPGSCSYCEHTISSAIEDLLGCNVPAVGQMSSSDIRISDSSATSESQNQLEVHVIRFSVRNRQIPVRFRTES